jgi:hypothetical protein
MSGGQKTRSPVPCANAEDRARDDRCISSLTSSTPHPQSDVVMMYLARRHGLGLLLARIGEGLASLGRAFG